MSEDSKQDRSDRAKMVQDEVESAIERCLLEGDVTYAEALGALALVRARLELKYFKTAGYLEK